MAVENERLMVHCNGCGFNVEREDVVDYSEYSSLHCNICAKCKSEPLMRESYRRGFNDGLYAMSGSISNVVETMQSKLHKPSTRD